MCARITQQLSPDRINELYGVRAMPLPADQKPRYNGAPGQDFSACRLEQDGTFERRAVSTRVNSVRNDDLDILTPAPESGLF